MTCYKGLQHLLCCVGERHTIRSQPADQEANKQVHTSSSDSLYAWVSPEESEQIRELRASLPFADQQQLNSEPEDIRHDLMMCRFLRGHPTVQRASQALQAHLKYRRENRELLSRIRSRIPAGMADFDDEPGLWADEMKDKFKMLQLPGWSGTNDGMPVSLINFGLFSLQELLSVRKEKVLEYFQSCVEIRSVCLHNQSVRERRLVRVVEVRDNNGFSFSDFFASPKAVFLLGRCLTIGLMYPEFAGGLSLFNMTPGSRWMRLLSNMIPQELKAKLIFAERGDWQQLICIPRGMSPAAMVKWAAYVQENQQHSHLQDLNLQVPQAVRALKMRAGSTCSWHVQCDPPSRNQAFELAVSVHFFGDARPAPEYQACRMPQRLASDDADGLRSCSGCFKVCSHGAVLLEVELRKGSSVPTLAVLSLGPGAEDEARSLDPRVMQSVSNRNSQTRSCTAKPGAGADSWKMCTQFLVVVSALVICLVFLSSPKSTP